MKYKIAVIIPAYNEEQTIKNVILDFNSYYAKDNYERQFGLSKLV